MGRGLGTYRHRTKILPMLWRPEFDIPDNWISIRKGGHCIQDPYCHIPRMSVLSRLKIILE